VGELHVHSMAGATNFAKPLRPFQKHWIQKSDMKQVQNLKYRHSLGVVAHDLKIPRVCLSPHPELQVTFIPGDT
jgi:hypothetical protein